MKKFTCSITAFLIIFLVACSGSDGQDGLDGIDGTNGIDGEDGTDATPIAIFEIGANLFLNPNANWYATLYQPFPNDEPIENDDVVLVYRLEFITGDNLDVWRQLPRPYFTDQGSLYYSFDFTTDGFLIYLEADFDISTWQESDLLVSDQIFRIVVIPSELLDVTSKTDWSNLVTVMQSYGVHDSDIKRFAD